MPDLSGNVVAQTVEAPRKLRLLAICAITIAIAVLPLVGARALYGDDGFSRNAFLTELALPFIHLLILSTIAVLLARTGIVGDVDILWWRRRCSDGWWTLILVPVALFTHTFIGWLVQRLGLRLSPDVFFYADEQPLAFYVAMTIVGVILTPVIEELFWRGYVQTILTYVFGGFGGFLGQAILFAVIHMRPIGGFITVFVLGVITGLWRWRRRTLLPIILVHMAINALWYTARWPGWLDFTRIRVTTDYIDQMNELARPTNYDPHADARFDYEKALQLAVRLPDGLNAVRGGYPADWDGKIRETAEEWIVANEQALGYVAQGANKPYYWPAYKDRDAILVPESRALRTLGLALGTRIKMEAFEGKHEQMCSDIATLYSFGGHFCGTKALIHEYTGLWIRRMAMSILQQILARESLSADMLATIQGRLEPLADGNDYLIDFSLEHLTSLDDIQGLFTDEEDGGGHIPKGAFRPNALSSDQEQALLRLKRRETAKAVDEFFPMLQRAQAMTPWQLHSDLQGVQSVLWSLVHSNAYVEWRLRSLILIMEEPWRNRVYLNATTATLGVMRYQRDHGEYPDSLEQLVEAGYLEHVPLDCYSDGPLVYERTADGFLLYSFGADFDDDGGTPSKWGEGKEGGDQVFWAVRDGE